MLFATAEALAADVAEKEERLPLRVPRFGLIGADIARALRSRSKPT